MSEGWQAGRKEGRKEGRRGDIAAHDVFDFKYLRYLREHCIACGNKDGEDI